MAQSEIRAGCPVSRKCGGCQLQNLRYTEQLQHKQRLANRLLDKFGSVEPVIGMETPFHYRNKAQAAFIMHGKEILSGVYQSSTRRVVAVGECLLQQKQADAVIGSIRKLMKSFKLKAFDAQTGRGWLRHVLIRSGFRSGEMLVVLVTGTPLFPSKRSFVNALIKKHPEITSLVHHVNTSRVELLLGKQQEVLYGTGTIEDTLCGLSFRISPHSFYQVNPVQTERLYNLAMDYAGFKGGETVIDAYCGIGTIGLIAASRGAGRVIGVESVPEAVKDAKFNAKRNKRSNTEFCCADAGEVLAEMQEAGEQADVVFLDPPRAGSSRKFLQALLKLQPQKIVYISCNPETLARDLKQLTAQKGYKVKNIQPVDLFPHTNHLETVVLLEKVGKQS